MFRVVDRRWLALLVLITVDLTVLAVVWPANVPFTTLVVPMVLGSFVLSPRTLPWFVVFTVVCLTVMVSVSDDVDKRALFSAATVMVVAVIVMFASFRRSRLGIAGVLGESMLVDLRERLARQSNLPGLPEGWHAEAVMRSAGGTPFAGDFIVASLSTDARELSVVVVDVSGKGEQAGTRALQLSGAFGGLLTALPADRFLPAANDYLLRQDWDEGFATAIHLWLDLTTGRFEIRKAGHPPAVQLVAGAGRWVVHATDGPILGLLPWDEYGAATGTMSVNDALLLYTDGLVETPTRDISLGIDKLLGQGERLLQSGFENGGATQLIDRLESRNDDRALLLVHRTRV